MGRRDRRKVITESLSENCYESFLFLLIVYWAEKTRNVSNKSNNFLKQKLRCLHTLRKRNLQQLTTFDCFQTIRLSKSFCGQDRVPVVLFRFRHWSAIWTLETLLESDIASAWIADHVGKVIWRRSWESLRAATSHRACFLHNRPDERTTTGIVLRWIGSGCNSDEICHRLCPTLPSSPWQSDSYFLFLPRSCLRMSSFVLPHHIWIPRWLACMLIWSPAQQ